MPSDLTGSDCTPASSVLFPANLGLVSDMPLADTPESDAFQICTPRLQISPALDTPLAKAMYRITSSHQRGKIMGCRFTRTAFKRRQEGYRLRRHFLTADGALRRIRCPSTPTRSGLVGALSQGLMR